MEASQQLGEPSGNTTAPDPEAYGKLLEASCFGREARRASQQARIWMLHMDA